MGTKLASVLALAVFGLLVASSALFTKTAEGGKALGNPVVTIRTSEGTIKVELWPDKAPISVKNFLRYVEEGFYDGLIFHRVIPTFMIQGGGFTPDMKQKRPHEPIKNEAQAEVKNERGTLAMARTGIVDSATCQFFINVKDNPALDHRDDADGFGYAVFGKVIDGMNVVDKIKNVATHTVGPHQNVPETPVIIQSARVAGKEQGLRPCILSLVLPLRGGMRSSWTLPRPSAVPPPSWRQPLPRREALSFPIPLPPFPCQSSTCDRGCAELASFRGAFSTEHRVSRLQIGFVLQRGRSPASARHREEQGRIMAESSEKRTLGWVWEPRSRPQALVATPP